MAGEADILLDFRNTFSSISLLKMTEIFKRMQPLQILEIRGTDLDTKGDLLKVLPKASYEVLSDRSGNDGGDGYKIRIRKRAI